VADFSSGDPAVLEVHVKGQQNDNSRNLLQPWKGQYDQGEKGSDEEQETEEGSDERRKIESSDSEPEDENEGVEEVGTEPAKFME
jgi:hypothetical protein